MDNASHGSTLMSCNAVKEQSFAILLLWFGALSKLHSWCQDVTGHVDPSAAEPNAEAKPSQQQQRQQPLSTSLQPQPPPADPQYPSLQASGQTQGIMVLPALLAGHPPWSESFGFFSLSATSLCRHLLEARHGANSFMTA